MDKSITSILEALSNQIDSKELAAALKADNFEGEYALSDDGITSILNQTKGLLSVDSAINNADVIEKISKDLYPKHMKTALAKREEQLKPIFDINRKALPKPQAFLKKPIDEKEFLDTIASLLN